MPNNKQYCLHHTASRHKGDTVPTAQMDSTQIRQRNVKGKISK